MAAGTVLVSYKLHELAFNSRNIRVLLVPKPANPFLLSSCAAMLVRAEFRAFKTNALERPPHVLKSVDAGPTAGRRRLSAALSHPFPSALSTSNSFTSR